MNCEYDESRVARPRFSPDADSTSTTEGPTLSLASAVFHASEPMFSSGDLAIEAVPGLNDPQLDFLNGNSDLLFDEHFAFGSDKSDQYQCSTELSLPLHRELDKKPGAWCVWMRMNVSLAVLTEDPLVESRATHLGFAYPERSLAQHNADLVIHSLRSFPTMMLRKETLPWFIHPHSRIFSRSAEPAFPEALSNCMSIAHIYASRTSGTSQFLQQTIKAECRRLTSEVCSILVHVLLF